MGADRVPRTTPNGLPGSKPWPGNPPREGKRHDLTFQHVQGRPGDRRRVVDNPSDTTTSTVIKPNPADQIRSSKTALKSRTSVVFVSHSRPRWRRR
jgi:hypothetical protein